MLTVLIGHRGVGKSTLLQAIQKHCDLPNYKFADLDQEVEKKIGKKVFDLFQEKGEANFRRLENEIFQELTQQNANLIMAVGAGFLSDIPASRVIWVRRTTDSDGRVFLNRPRLNPKLSPLEEYQERYKLRSYWYENRCTEQLLLKEGDTDPAALVRLMFQEVKPGQLPVDLQNIGGIVTLQPEDFRLWDVFISRRLQWGVDRFELRNDLLSPRDIQLALKDIPKDKILFSVRKPQDAEWYARVTAQHIEVPDRDGKRIQIDRTLWSHLATDWDLSIGDPPEGLPATILSLHTNDIAHAEDLETQSTPEQHLKLAVAIKNFEQLQAGFDWQQRDPQRRSFLPMTAEGSKLSPWTWFRQRMKSEQKLNFWRQMESAVTDQPTLSEWLATPTTAKTFAAVLGCPSRFSYTPAYHRAFFAGRNMFTSRIEMPEDTLTESSLQILSHIGLRCAAVTSPLKQKAFTFSKPQNEQTQNLKSVNTLMFKDGQWLSWNTDVIAMKTLLADLQTPLAVWGGGGTKEAMRSIVPDAMFFRARDGKSEDVEHSDALKSFSPFSMIWAAGRTHAFQWPPEHWKPQVLFDLNYQENSPGREYALRVNCEYRSGLEMFELQAQEQQKIWTGIS